MNRNELPFNRITKRIAISCMVYCLFAIYSLTADENFDPTKIKFFLIFVLNYIFWNFVGSYLAIKIHSFNIGHRLLLAISIGGVATLVLGIFNSTIFHAPGFAFLIVTFFQSIGPFWVFKIFDRTDELSPYTGL